MCGIAGIFSIKPLEAGFWIQEFENISAQLQHRGPDDEGFVLFRDSGEAIPFAGKQTSPLLNLPALHTASGQFVGGLLHRRLAIVGLGPAGHQPFGNDGNLWLTYNGEIFNYREIDAKSGFQNHSGTDTETLYNLCRKDVSDAVRHLDGFYAFAAYNTETRKLELRRDPTGVKPLYISEEEGLFRFSSEPGVLLRSTRNKVLDPRAVYHFLSEGIFIPGMELFPVTEQVQDGLSIDTVTFESYINEGIEPEDKPINDLRADFSKSIQRRLMSDVPLGFAVSGGIDSAAVIGFARKHLGKDAKLDLFSVISTDRQSDESQWQQQVAEFNNAEWHTVNIESAGPHLLEEVVNSTGLPAVAWNNLAHFELCRLTKQHGVTVLFNGQGADELFGGYPDYLMRDFISLLPFILKNKATLPLDFNSTAKGWLKLKMAGMLNIPVGRFKSHENGLLVRELKQYSPYLWQLALLRADRKMYADYFGQKLGQMLMWEDRNGMAHSLESRNPFADDLALANWLNVPFKDKLTNGYTKGVLRDAVKGYMPESVRLRVDKKGFTVPDASLTWKHRNDWEGLLMSSRLDDWSPRLGREKLLKSLKQDDESSLRWYFRLASFSAFLTHHDL
jgi:asparagine synthase (glutamine-hydrolysing)